MSPMHAYRLVPSTLVSPLLAPTFPACLSKRVRTSRSAPLYAMMAEVFHRPRAHRSTTWTATSRIQTFSNSCATSPKPRWYPVRNTAPLPWSSSPWPRHGWDSSLPSCQANPPLPRSSGHISTQQPHLGSHVSLKWEELASCYANRPAHGWTASACEIPRPLTCVLLSRPYFLLGVESGDLQKHSACHKAAATVLSGTRWRVFSAGLSWHGSCCSASARCHLVRFLLRVYSCELSHDPAHTNALSD
jgi:hypothetical protein